MAVWLSGWTAGTFFFDYLCVTGIYAQYQSQSYPAVTGSITKSKVVTTRDSEGEHSHAEVEYEFWVDGQQFKGDQLRFGVNVNDGSARQTVAKYKAGSEHTIYFQPDDPTVSALSRGLGPSDFFFPMFLVPFNMITLGGWTAIGSYLIGRVTPRPASIKVRSSGRETLYRVYVVRPIYVAIASAGAAGFATMFLVGIPLMIFKSWILVAIGWSIIAAVTFIGWWRVKPMFVEVDSVQETVTVISNTERQWKRSEIKEIAIKTELSERLKKVDSATIVGQDGDKSPILCSSTDAATWLSEQLRRDLRIGE